MERSQIVHIAPEVKPLRVKHVHITHSATDGRVVEIHCHFRACRLQANDMVFEATRTEAMLGKLLGA